MIRSVRKLTCALLAFFAAASVCVGCALFAYGASAAESWNVGELDMSGAPTDTLTFAPVIGDNMLYQQNQPACVWGFAPAGTKVTVSLLEADGQTSVQAVETETDAAGYWQADLEGRPASYDEYIIRATDGETTITAKNVLFGELFLSAGQSNMALNVKYCSNADEIISSANNPYIRVFLAPEIASAAEEPYYPAAYWPGGTWARGDSGVLIQGASAVCYNFALELYDRLNRDGAEVPVGFLNASKGSTSIEAWISRPAIDNENAEVYQYLDARGRLLDESEYNHAGSQNFNQVSAMFNSKIAPLSNLYVAGILWYQGENNVGNEEAGQYYRKALALLAEDWSAWFNDGETPIPFIYAQITPHNYTYEGEALAYMWEGMAEAWSDNPSQMAMVTTYDIPLDWYNTDFAYRSPIHPIVKKPVGQRMATLAYNRLYGGTGLLSSPVFAGATYADGKAVVSFQNASALSTTDGLDVRGFTLCGSNRIFYPAEAVINADGTVTVQSRWVKDPVAVAYAFSEMNIASNLCSAEGFPVAPFRSDKAASTYYHPKDWQTCDATQYFVSYGSGTDEALAKMRDGYTRSTNVSLSVAEAGDYGNALQLSYTLRGKEEFWIAPVLGEDRANGIFEQFISYDTLFFKVCSGQQRDVTLARVEIELADGRTWNAAALEGASTDISCSDAGYQSFCFSLNPTFADEDATAEELAALRAQIAEIRIVFRDISSGFVLLDSFEYGNAADLVSADSGTTDPVDPNVPDRNETDDPETADDTPNKGIRIALIAVGSVLGAVVVGAVVYLVMKRSRKTK